MFGVRPGGAPIGLIVGSWQERGDSTADGYTFVTQYDNNCAVCLTTYETPFKSANQGFRNNLVLHFTLSFR